MKKLVVLLVVFMLSGCSNSDIKPEHYERSYYYTCIDGTLYLERYSYHEYGITTMLNDDGTPKKCDKE